jgi:glycosyltransferase involved in cell wall biosynthesis
MTASYDVLCFSHLRWDFVWQRPQHLLSRFAQQHRLFYIEEPMFGFDEATLDISMRDCGVMVVVPQLRGDLGAEEAEDLLRGLVTDLVARYDVSQFVVWQYTPMALPLSRNLSPLATVYDCMDELSAFLGAPPVLLEREVELLRGADLVFTGGASLFEAKRAWRADVHLFPSSVDRAHFALARQPAVDPSDQAAIARPRIGFFGVIDERMDLELIAAVADSQPDWQLVFVGPVVKIDPGVLPHRPNIHYLGSKQYEELPRYVAGWDVALLPFARNEATRFISPTKTLEYLAAGKPVVSTPINDVVRSYGENGLVRIAATPHVLV